MGVPPSLVDLLLLQRRQVIRPELRYPVERLLRFVNAQLTGQAALAQRTIDGATNIRFAAGNVDVNLRRVDRADCQHSLVEQKRNFHVGTKRRESLVER